MHKPAEDTDIAKLQQWAGSLHDAVTPETMPKTCNRALCRHAVRLSINSKHAMHAAMLP